MTFWLWIALFALSWAACGVIAYGLTVAYFYAKFPTLRDDDDYMLARFMCIMGPLGLVVALLMGGTGHGWRWSKEDADNQT